MKVFFWYSYSILTLFHSSLNYLKCQAWAQLSSNFNLTPIFQSRLTMVKSPKTSLIKRWEDETELIGLGFTIQPIIHTLMFKISELYVCSCSNVCTYVHICLKSCWEFYSILFFTFTMNLKLLEKLVGLKKFVNLFLFNGI